MVVHFIHRWHLNGVPDLFHDSFTLFLSIDISPDQVNVISAQVGKLCLTYRDPGIWNDTH